MLRLTRTLSAGDTGLDVEGCRRALIRYLQTGTLAKFNAKPDDERQTFDSTAVQQTKRAQEKLGIPVDGEIGQKTESALRAAGAFDKAADQLLAEYADEHDKAVLARRKADAARAKMVEIALALHARRFRISYDMGRPTQLRPVSLTTRLDCSGLCSRCAWGAGVMPGVDWRYQNTWTLVEKGRPVTRLQDVLPGDFVFYGRSANDPTHMAIVISVSKGRARIVTNGHYPMSIEDIDYRRDRVAIRRLV